VLKTVSSFIARALILLEIYRGVTLFPPTPPGSEIQKKPRQNRVKVARTHLLACDLDFSIALSAGKISPIHIVVGIVNEESWNIKKVLLIFLWN